MDWGPIDASIPSGSLRSVASSAASILDDDASFVELLLERPELVAPDLLLVAEMRGVEEGAGPGRILLGWRRDGGPALIGVTTGSGSAGLLVETIAFAERNAGWTPSQWDAAVRRHWEAAPIELRERLAARWGLVLEAPWVLGSWTRAAWAAEPAPGVSAIGLVGTRIPDSVRDAVTWLAEREPVAAFRIRWYGEDAVPAPRIDRLAGSWETRARAAAVPAPAPAAPPVAAEPTTTGHPYAARLVAEIEQRCRELGGRVTHRDGWVRLEVLRSLRVFPGPLWIDLQFVRIDEGALVGFRYRYGLPLSFEPPPGAPPSAHLRVAGSRLPPAVVELVERWLAGAIPRRSGPPAPPWEPRIGPR